MTQLSRSTDGSCTILHMTSPVLSEWVDWMTAQGLSERTIVERSAFVSRLGNPLTASRAALLAELGRPELSNSSRRTYRNHVKAFYTWAVDMGYLDTNPVDKLPNPRVPRSRQHTVSTVDVQRLARAPMRRRTRAMILLATYQGLRVHEIVKVRAEDVDLDLGTLTVAGKGGVIARLPLSDVIRELAGTMPAAGYWFPSGDGHMKANSASDTIGKAMRRAGVKGSAHSLRRYYGTQMLRRGANLRVVQELLRHAQLSTTALYTEIDESQMRSAIDSLAA
ncbi:site-specific tyrosine recombinase XerD [Brevibacterium luteolum]